MVVDYDKMEMLCGFYIFSILSYGVATISRLLKITGLFCKRAR